MLNACEAPANQRRDVHVRAIEHLQVAARVLEVLEAWYKAPNTMSVSVVLLECRSPTTSELEAPAVGGTIDSAAVPRCAGFSRACCARRQSHLPASTRASKRLPRLLALSEAGR